MLKEEKAYPILKIIIQAVKSSPDSFWQACQIIRGNDLEALTIIKDNIFSLEAYSSIEEGLAFDDLGITTGAERFSFLSICKKLNLEKIKKADPSIVVKKLNEAFVAKEIIFRADVAKLSKIISSIEKLITLEQAKSLIHVIDIWPELLDILPYCNRYIRLNEETGFVEIATLTEGYNNARIVIALPDTKGLLVDLLAQAGHPRSVTDRKDIGTLLTITERMIYAGNAVLSLKKRLAKNSFSKAELIDEIAKYWLNEEEISMRNTTDYIIPPPSELEISPKEES